MHPLRWVQAAAGRALITAGGQHVRRPRFPLYFIMSVGDNKDDAGLSKGSPQRSLGCSTARDCMTEPERKIIAAHDKACQALQENYVDPETGCLVFTKFAHLQRGKCCGSGCRHCPYDQVNVKHPAKKKQFNSFYYT